MERFWPFVHTTAEFSGPENAYFWKQVSEWRLENAYVALWTGENWRHSPNFIQSPFVLPEGWAVPLNVRHIMVANLLYFYKEDAICRKTSVAKAFSVFVSYKVTLNTSKFNWVGSLHWRNSVCPNHVLPILKNKRFIGLISSCRGTALEVILFSCACSLFVVITCGRGWTLKTSCGCQSFWKRKGKTLFSKHYRRVDDLYVKTNMFLTL